MRSNLVFDKVTIIGAGYVGATTAYALMNGGTTSEIAMIDLNEKKLAGEIMDLNHGITFVPPVKIHAGTYEDCKDSNIVIITAGVNQRPGETRIDLLKRNIEVFKAIVPNITKYNENCVILVVTNPVDVLTYATLKISGLPPSQVIGSGTVLDSARFKIPDKRALQCINAKRPCIHHRRTRRYRSSSMEHYQYCRYAN
jgi:L-lactate dehydrogenase (EC 1.1.1.27)